MSKMKKLLAMLLTLAMVLGMSMTTMATDTKHNDAIRVYGVEAEDNATVTVTAYQIIKYNENGYYEEVLKDTITKNGDELAPTSGDVAKLALRTTELTTKETLTKPEGANYYTGTLAAGTWMIIVTGSADYLYNPAIISVEQGANGLVYGELNLDTDSWGTNVYLKKSEPGVTKEAEKANSEDTAIEAVQYGDVIKFTVTADIPSYTDERTNIVLKITDTLEGLKLVDNETYSESVTITNPDEASDEVKLDLDAMVDDAIVAGATSFEVNITKQDAWLIKHAGEQIVITYYAEVSTDAKVKVDELNNTVTFEYSTNDGVQTKSDVTYHYTFGFDNEIYKVDEKDTTVKLDGAVFELHVGSANGELFKDAAGKTQFTTGEDGSLAIYGLDSDVTYYLVEVKAPTGYTLNATPITVKFDAKYDTNGKLTSYDVVIDGNKVATYTFASSETAETVTLVGEAKPHEFKNTKLVSLPSTGGIGTTIFTLGGCAIMIAAAYLFFASRRKEA